MANYVYLGNIRLIEYLEPRLAEAGFSRTDDITSAEYMLTYCTSMSQLEDIYFGQDGIVQSIEGSITIVDMSATTPNFANEISAVTTISSLAMVDAPLVVIDKVAKHAFDRENMMCFVGGEEKAIEQAKPLLDVIFSRIETVASPGGAQLAHIDATLQSVSSILSAIEISALVEHSKRTVSSLELKGWQPTPATPEAAAVIEAVKAQRFECPYTAEMLMSEVSAAIMAADDYELIIPQAESAFHLLELLAIIGGAGKSPAALALVYETDSNHEAYGLDWSRAESLYPHEHDGASDLFDDEDDYLETAFGSSFDYSSN